MAICDGSCLDGPCFACRLRLKGLQVSPRATPNRRNSVPPRKPDPAWERGVAGERRPGGGFMPYLGANGQPIHVKEAGERRHEIAGQVDRLKRDPHIFAAERKPAAT